MKLIQKNDPEYKNINSEVKEVLKKFQSGYIKRDPALVDSYMDELFAKGNDIVIVGTCDGEWCLGFDDAREIVDSDWQYWGDVRIDIENADISTNGDFAWFITNGSVKYSFEDSDAKYDRWLNSIKDIINETGSSTYPTDKAKLAHINWMLSLFMSARPDKKRNYKWPLRLTGVLEKKDGRWIFRFMQFCLPNEAQYPDIRYTNLQGYEKEYVDVNKKLDEFKASNTIYNSSELSNVLKGFQNEYLTSEIDDFIKKYFLSDNSINMTGMTGNTLRGTEDIHKVIESHRNLMDTLCLDVERAVTSESRDAAWVVTSGYIKKNLMEEAAVSRQIEEIKKIIGCNASDNGNQSGCSLASKDKMFRIRKEISLMFREISKGDEYVLPIRFEGFLLKEGSSFKFQNARFSYPYTWVIEGHYETEMELSEKGV